MENIFLTNDIELIESSREQKLTKEQEIQRSTWFDDEPDSKKHSFIDSQEEHEEKEIDRYNIKLPEGYEEIELYDDCKTFEENFKIGKSKKYILIQVKENTNFTIVNPESVLPTTQSKCIIDIKKVNEHSSLEFIPIDYDTFFGLRYLTFKKYKSDFFSCDERVMFEALLIKYKAFDFKSFYWSKEKIFEEVGIKKDRSDKILNRFIELGIITKKLKKSLVNNRPMQINYYEICPYEVIDLIPKIYEERDRVNIEIQMKKHLQPVLSNIYYSSKMQ